MRQCPLTSLADVIPTIAPVATSVSQCLLSFIRDHPTPVDGIKSHCCPGSVNVIRQGGSQGEGDGRMPRGHRIVARERVVTVGVEARVRPGAAGCHLHTGRRGSRERQGRGQPAAGSGKVFVAADQSGADQAEGNSPVYLGLAEVPQNAGGIVRMAGPISLDKSLGRLIQQHQAGNTAEEGQPVPPTKDQRILDRLRAAYLRSDRQWMDGDSRRQEDSEPRLSRGAHSYSEHRRITFGRGGSHWAWTSPRGLVMQRSFGAVLLLTALTSCRDYDLQSRVTSQGGLVPADQFARYGREQAEAMAIAREFGADLKRSSPADLVKQAEAASRFARAIPDVADVQADPLGYRLTLRFKSGWRTMVTPINDGKRGTETVGLPAGAGATTAQ